MKRSRSIHSVSLKPLAAAQVRTSGPKVVQEWFSGKGEFVLEPSALFQSPALAQKVAQEAIGGQRWTGLLF